MHNCKATKDDLIELAMSRTDQNQLPADELENCPDCREEFASLRNALRTTEAAIHFGQPSENFWSGYHERLRRRLEREPRNSNGWLPPPPRINLSLWLRRLATTSIPVPVPLASAVFVFLIFSIFFMTHSRQSSGADRILTPPSVITKTIEVPVIRERLITRVVYRKLPAPPHDLTARDGDRAELTGSQQPEVSSTDEGLEGFKPANEAKLTIIKGSYRDEK